MFLGVDSGSDNYSWGKKRLGTMNRDIALENVHFK